MTQAIGGIIGGLGGGISDIFGGGSNAGDASSDAVNSAVASQDALGPYRSYYAQQLYGLYSDPGAFLSQLPGYQFQMDQGRKQIEASHAAQGNLVSGNTLADLMTYGQGLASTNIGQYAGMLSALSAGNPDYANILAQGNLARVGGQQQDRGTGMGALGSIFNGMMGMFGSGGGSGGGFGNSFGSGGGIGDLFGASSNTYTGDFSGGGDISFGGGGYTFG